VTSRESFVKIENWLNELETYSTNLDIVKMLVGNKVSGKNLAYPLQGDQIGRIFAQKVMFALVVT
jgi:GTPase SAR1 family protein